MTDMAAQGTGQKVTQSHGKVRVWDPVIRIVHWTLVASFAVAWLTAEESQPVHEVA